MTNTKGNIMSTRSVYHRGPLVTQVLREFDSLPRACEFVKRMTPYNRDKFCFNIQQTSDDHWVVSRVVCGGVEVG